MTPAHRRRAVRRLLLSSLRGRGRQLRGLAGWSVVEALPAYLSGRLVAQALDDGFLAGRSGTGVAWLGLLGVSLAVGAWGTRQTYQRLAGLVEPFRDELVTLAVTGALRRSTVPGAPTATAGVARVTHHVEIVREAYAGALMVVQGFLVTAVSALLGLLTLVPAALVLVLPPLLVALTMFVGALTQMAARQRASILAGERIAEAATIVVGGLRDVVACGAEETAYSAVGAHIEDQARATTDLARFTAVRTVAIAIGGLLPLFLLLVAAPRLLDNGATTGAVLGALTYVLRGVYPALQILVSELGDTGLWLFVTLGRIVEAIEEPEQHRPSEAGAPPDDLVPPPETLALNGHHGRHDVRLRGVTFRYGPWAEPVIRDLDLVIPTGDHLVVVGPSGVGKSTLVGLIAGLLRPETGDVSIGGVAVDDADRPARARRRVLIPQEAYVFAGTLGENLTYLRDDAAPSEVDDAIDLLGARALVERLGGPQAILHPSSLSAGERQLITLVRAYLSPARLVVLDEATCHLDPAAEVRVERAFARRPGTLLVVAHRISSALRARRVLVLDGTETHLGSHEELLASSTLYRDLVGHWV
ncbi:MAG: ATP-binding cassette domain-containing protein [Acidimicrobiia bacterium]